MDGLSFQVRPGLVTGFVGLNAAGKSTTRMVLGLDTPTSGTVTVGGSRYAELPAPLRLEAQHGIVTGVPCHGTKAQRRRHRSLVSRMSRREVVLSAAVELFAERGYHAAGIDEAGNEQNRSVLFDEWRLLLRRARPDLSKSAVRIVAYGVLGSCLAVTAARDLRWFDARGTHRS